MTIIPQKTCSRCAQTKPLDQFSKGNNRCKPCVAAEHREKRRDPEWRARQLQSQRASWERRRQNPDFVESERTRTRNYQREMLHDPIWKQKRSRYYSAYNKRPDQRSKATDRFRAYRNKRQQNDHAYHARLMGVAKRGWHKRRALLISNGGSYTQAQWDQLCALYNHHCVKCGAGGPLSVDHVVPLTKGGSNDIANLQPLCRSCNSRKHTKIADYRPFLPELD